VVVRTEHGDDAAADVEHVDELNRMVPGLGDAIVDLLDAVHDRVDELGPARPDLLARVTGHLAPRWAGTPTDLRPVMVLEALRAVLKPVR